jgi:hypothetical protein
MGGVAVYIGAAVLAVAGGALARWPAAAAALLTSDEDGNRLPPTPGNIRRARIAGWALVVFGAILAWYGPDAFRGPPDMGVP